MKISFLYGLSRGDFYLFLTEKDLDCPVTSGLSDQGRLCIAPVCRAGGGLPEFRINWPMGV